MCGQVKFDQAINSLRSAGASMRCQELADLLTGLGFDVRDGKKVGHKIIVHHGISRFTSASYTCGHGKNPEIIRPYINQIKRILEQYKTELIQHLGERNEH